MDENGVVIKNKARLVARGYNQQEGIHYEETFILVARLEAIRIFLAYAAYMGFMVYQMDVKSAFLNRKISEEVYVQQPPWFESSEFPNHVCKLDKALYGLKQAPEHCPDESGVSVNETLFRDMIGLLMYLIASRPDIQFSTCLYARGLSNTCGKASILECKKQSSMAMSLVEAEYVAAVGCYAQVFWIKTQLVDYDVLYNKIQFRRISLTGFPAQSVRSSNAIALDSPYFLVLITGMSQSRQHVDTSLIHIESRKPPTAELFDVDSGRISIITVNTKEYHSDVLAIITRIMRRTLDNSL
ncbi:retrovirus-related pol polyprotein from transposon TNT 1-94 [Tanacetum coccineum]